MARNININATATINAQGFDTTFSGTISDLNTAFTLTGTLIKTGAGTLALANNINARSISTSRIRAPKPIRVTQNGRKAL